MNLAARLRPEDINEVLFHDVDNIRERVRKFKEVGEGQQGFLLEGPPGVGKTTIARAVGRFLNGGDAGTIEIDAASNNGVDNIREIIENARYRGNTRYKLYILDEAHMLSKGAFNALLKLLEDSPEHVYFMLCTTEPRKIPETIKSRLDRVQLKKIPDDIIIKRLFSISGEFEDMPPIEEEAAEAIAKTANGDLRTAIKYYEAAADRTADGDFITAEIAADVVGMNSREHADFMVSMGKRQGEKMEEILIKSNLDPVQFLKSQIIFTVENVGYYFGNREDARRVFEDLVEIKQITEPDPETAHAIIKGWARYYE